MESYSISIAADNDSSTSVYDLWEEASVFESHPSMSSIGYPPHLTFGIYEGVTRDALEEALSSSFRDEPAIDITFSSIEIFDVSPIVMWAAPSETGPLHELHKRINARIPARFCHHHYRSGHWVPHCTLAVDVREECRDDVLAFAGDVGEPFTVVFDRADLVTTSSIKVRQSIALGL